MLSFLLPGNWVADITQSNEVGVETFAAGRSSALFRRRESSVLMKALPPSSGEVEVPTLTVLENKPEDPNPAPLRARLGPSFRVRLLRTFLPVTFFVVFSGELISGYVRWHPLSNPVLPGALQTLLVSLVVTVTVWRLARTMGRSIEQAESE